MTYREQIAAIVAEFTPVLKTGVNPETYAAGLLDEATEDEAHFEVRGLHTTRGAPPSFRI